MMVGCQNIVKDEPQQPLSAIEFKLGSNLEFPGAEVYLTREKKSIYVEKQVRLSGQHLSKASEGLNEMSQPMLNLEFNETGKLLFADVTKNNVGKLMAILVDDKVISAPTILGPIEQGKVVITGLESFDELKSMVKSIQRGIVNK